MNNGQHAENYADLGLFIIDIHPIRDGICGCGRPQCTAPGKHPISSNGLLSATRDKADIRERWAKVPDASIAVVCAPSNILILDLDIYHNDLEKLGALEQQLGPLPTTVTQRSGSSDGYHPFFRHPGFPVRGVIGGIVVRSNAYVILAPSNHISGGNYTWQEGLSLNDIAIAELPEAWKEALKKSAEVGQVGIPKVDEEPDWLKVIPNDKRIADMRAHFARELGEVKGTSTAGTTFNVVRSAIRSHGVRDPEAALEAAMEFDTKCVPPWGARMGRHVWTAYQKATSPSWGSAYRGEEQRLDALGLSDAPVLPAYPIPADIMVQATLQSVKGKRTTDPMKIVDKDLITQVLEKKYLGANELLAAQTLVRVCPPGTSDDQISTLLMGTNMTEDRARELVRQARPKVQAPIPGGMSFGSLADSLPVSTVPLPSSGGPNDLPDSDQLLMGTLKLDAEGEGVKSGPNNIFEILSGDSVVGGAIRFNGLTKQIEVTAERFNGVSSNVLATDVMNWMDKKWQLTANRTQIEDQLLLIARKNEYNPIADYLRSVVWDGKPRGNWLVEYCGAEDNEFNRRIGMMWLISAVARGIAPGSKVDTVLVLEGKQGAKKCLGRDTPVIMFDGSTKVVQDIVAGDLLMGPDSTPRRVLETTAGVGPLRKIVPTKGASWVCNDAHILTVALHAQEVLVGRAPHKHVLSDVDMVAMRAECAECGPVALQYKGTQRGQKRYACAKRHQSSSKSKVLVDAPVTHFAPHKWGSRHVPSNKYAMQVRAEGIEFSRREVSADPYLVGLWLGDGTCGVPEITNIEPEIHAYCASIADAHGVTYKHKMSNHACPKIVLSGAPHSKGVTGQYGRHRSNPVMDVFKTCLVGGDSIGDAGRVTGLEKYISREYLLNDTETRLQLLAGLIDSDGCLSNGTYMITTKWAGLRDDILFLARSLGLAAYSSENTKTIKSIGFSGQYHDICISGDICRVPVKVPRKKAASRQQVKDVLRTGFRVEDAGIGEYFGFELDGDSRFLLGDFTITHNSSALRVLAGPWFSDSPLIIGNKDSMQMASYRWIIELAELASLRSSETEAQKAFISACVDNYRPPYGKAPEEFRRFAVFGGSTNQGEYLPDETGNRRYWPCLISGCDTIRLRQDRDQLWAEATYRYLHADLNPDLAHPECPGERWWFETEEEQDMAAAVVDKRRPENAWAGLVREWARRNSVGVNVRRQWTLAEIAKSALDIEIEKLPARQKGISVAIKEAGLLPAVGDEGQQMWRLPDGERVDETNSTTTGLRDSN